MSHDFDLPEQGRDVDLFLHKSWIKTKYSETWPNDHLY